MQDEAPHGRWVGGFQGVIWQAGGVRGQRKMQSWDRRKTEACPETHASEQGWDCIALV